MSSIAVPAATEPAARLERFMSRPQRHRLLHGFPLAAAMPYTDLLTRQRAEAGDRPFSLQPDLDKELLVGVLPHPFCNPKVSGCGFCTFPHEAFHRGQAERVVESVITEIHDRVDAFPDVSDKKIRGVYFGGGTANLTPAESFRELARAVATRFDVSDAEVSLEGVPAYFVRRKPLLIDILREELPARHHRISMGMQTFSPQWLQRMGREAFGGAETFAEVVQVAHERDMTASGDLLINLPGQSLQEMIDDVRRAMAIGLDQVCVYHLVMFPGLGTPWSRDPELTRQLPDNERACDHWLAVREELIRGGFRQTTLTNFERNELQGDRRSYQYELLSFQPESCQMWGFGPSGISFVSDPESGTDLKTMNPESALQYVQSVRDDGPSWNRFYPFDREDRKVLHLTRHLAALAIDIHHYRHRFHREVSNDFGPELSVIEQARLMGRDADCLSLTPRGMFYADSIAGVLADRHLIKRRNVTSRMNDNSIGHM